MEYLQNVSSYLAARSGTYLLWELVIGSTALLLAISVALRMRSLTRPFRAIRATSDNPGEVMPSLIKAVEENQRAVHKLSSQMERMLAESTGFFKYVGLVRYDAFEDVGGKQSYSLCLLDGNRSGFIITYLTGRNSTRSYAVTVAEGQPSRKLSDEEGRAYDDALARETVPQGD